MIRPLCIWSFFLTTLTFVGCKEAYNPTLKDSGTNVLVVEGFINIGADSTIIKLSRMMALSGKKGLISEKGATVSVESETNERFLLPEKPNGVYAVAALNLNPAKKYRINIKTAKGVNYLSDFVQSKSSPAIDSLNWNLKNDGLHLYVNTHDSQNKTTYYRWEYVETWIFYSDFFSTMLFNGTDVVTRKFPEENINQCWKNGVSSSIYLGSSAKLAQDVISQQPIGFIPIGSEKFTEKYSMLVKQYALTKEAYEFWESLRKNTESLGSIFDAQPSQLAGNIRNTANADEPVVGYISVGSVQQKRIYVSRNELPSWLFLPRNGCTELDTVTYSAARQYFKTHPEVIPLEEIDPIGYTFASKTCVDCTLKGTNKKPNYWQ